MADIATPLAEKPQTKRGLFELLRTQLENERQSFVSHWRELGEFILPRRPRFFTTENNRGDRRNPKIVDSTATLSMRTLRSGLMSGITSPARPWFRLTVDDKNLAKVMAVKMWLEEVTDRMSAVFLRSNVYNSLPVVYGDLGTFATSAMFVEEDFDTVIRTYTFPIGSYMIANGANGKVDTFFREWRWTVRQVVEKFGVRGPDGKISNWDNFSDTVKQLYLTGQTEAWVEICHVIAPNRDADQSRLSARYKKFTSCYYERGVTGGGKQGYNEPPGDKFLMESGFDSFPVMVPRWEVSDGDVYGTDCPGMTALGDIKQLQQGERRKLQAIDKMVNPPMTGPQALRNRKASSLPGDITYVDVMSGQQGFVPAYQVDPRIDELENTQRETRARIQRVCFEDLFLMLSQSDRREITAREVEERHEEKLLALGPVLEQLNQDLLDPLIDRTFEIMLRQGRIPPPPDELQGVQLKIQYVSIMAQAQKLIGVASLERFNAFVDAKAAVDPSVLDKVDGDRLIEEMGEGLSVPAGVVRDQADVDEMRDQRAKARQAQEQIAAAEQAAKAGKTLSETKTTGDSALADVLAQGKAGELVQQ